MQADCEPDHDRPTQTLTDRAMWILKLKEKRKLTQLTLEEILEDVTELCSNLLVDLEQHVSSALACVGVKIDDVPGLSTLFSSESEFSQPFKHLNTYHHQLAFYRENFHFVVSCFTYRGKRGV